MFDLDQQLDAILSPLGVCREELGQASTTDQTADDTAPTLAFISREELQHFWSGFAAQASISHGVSVAMLALKALAHERAAQEHIDKVTEDSIAANSYTYAINSYESAIQLLTQAEDTWYEAALAALLSVVDCERKGITPHALMHDCLKQRQRITALALVYMTKQIDYHLLDLYENGDDELPVR